MRALFAGLSTLCLLGCGDFNEALKTERKPVNVPGFSPVDNNAGSQPVRRAANRGTPRKTPVVHKANAPKANPAPATNVARKNPPEYRGIVGKSTNQVFDKQQVMAENPNLVVIENKASGSDPVSYAVSTYITVGSKTSTLGFRNALKIFKGQHGRHPTYDELTRMMKQTPPEFAMLPPHRIYAYDAENGTIVVLENKIARE